MKQVHLWRLTETIKYRSCTVDVNIWHQWKREIRDLRFHFLVLKTNLKPEDLFIWLYTYLFNNINNKFDCSIHRQRWKCPSNIFQTQILPSQRHLNQTLDRWNVVNYIVTIKKILICPIGFINVHNKKITKPSDSQTKERRREHTDPVT